ncbi:MAG: hypothetical protein Q9168_003947 [Polycauliona sp. 1 TL-2023]
MSPSGQKNMDDTSPFPFYREHIGSRLKPQTRSLFENYSGIDPADVEPHLHKLRDRAWALQKYPCIGQWSFLRPHLLQCSWYPSLTHRLRSGASILDIGCCFGQDLRFLAADGIPTDNMYATDIIPEFWDLSSDLFLDAATFKARFIQADILDPSSPLTKQLADKKIDIMLVNQVFHLFNRETQVSMAKNLIELGSSDTWIAGWQIGGRSGKPSIRHQGTIAGHNERLFHNDQSWQEMWRQIGEETGTQWEVQTSSLPLEAWGCQKEDIEWLPSDAVGFEFICRRKG